MDEQLQARIVKFCSKTRCPNQVWSIRSSRGQASQRPGRRDFGITTPQHKLRFLRIGHSVCGIQKRLDEIDVPFGTLLPERHDEKLNLLLQCLGVRELPSRPRLRVRFNNISGSTAGQSQASFVAQWRVGLVLLHRLTCPTGMLCGRFAALRQITAALLCDRRVRLLHRLTCPIGMLCGRVAALRQITSAPWWEHNASGVSPDDCVGIRVFYSGGGQADFAA
mmetsp:Transcript_123507/g.349109  ORF Transcript_123507/g.349109 Transcript_123507/m.349109 type:complete len:222 (-) Transcript_123507:201-866(-)